MCEVCSEEEEEERRSRPVVWDGKGRRAIFVVVYDLDRVMGGPEEGGWWYNTGELVYAEVADDEDTAERRVKYLKAHEWKDTGDLSSVAFRGHAYDVHYETDGRMPVKHYPVVQPHYE